MEDEKPEKKKLMEDILTSSIMPTEESDNNYLFYDPLKCLVKKCAQFGDNLKPL